ncbi:MAG: DUF1318 domain-containing protein [bacterium]
MKRGMNTRLSIVKLAVIFCLVSCAVITVNIYFPEKDVQEAYKALEQELMTPGEPGPGDEQPSGTVKPQSRLRFEWVGEAAAEEEGQAQKIAETVKKMPDVVEAYRQMGARVAAVDRLRDGGLAGEANSGLLVPREGTLSPADQKLVEAENADRRTVIRGMARAIIRINRKPENDENMKQVLPQATAQFASIRRDSAKKGWWIQDPSGNWTRK